MHTKNMHKYHNKSERDTNFTCFTEATVT